MYFYNAFLFGLYKEKDNLCVPTSLFKWYTLFTYSLFRHTCHRQRLCQDTLDKKGISSG